MSIGPEEIGTATSASRERRIRRLLTGGLVVALLAGPLAGFAIARAGDDGGSDVATGGGGGQEYGASAVDAARSSVAFGFGGPLEKLFFRTSADGVEIRAYRPAPAANDLPATDCGPTASCPVPVPICKDTTTEATVVGELSTEAAVTIATGSASPASGTAVPSASWGVFGIQEEAPARWVIASTGPTVARVRATFSGGTTDEMEPVDGVVMLASKVGDPNAADGALEALDADGSVVQSIDLTSGDGGVSSSAVGSGCVGPVPAPPPMPPLTLPPPGEQPADPETTRAEIATAFAKSFDGNVSPEESTLYEEGPGVSPEEVARSPYAAQAGHTTASVTDVVFTSPTTASVRYDISIDNWPNQFPGQSGTALLIDGRWKVSQATVCAAAAIGGLRCG